ncbi:MAG: LysM peptidoglycan-binding domain-containing protein [Chloroflexi bacterium]|nr:LysM peptidoglycan-binding domain-containing protein [Chloroflexota bacterium]
MGQIKSKSRRADRIARVPLTLEHIVGARSSLGYVPLRLFAHLLILLLAGTIALAGGFGRATGGLTTFSVQRAVNSPAAFVQPRVYVQDDLLLKLPELVTTLVNRPRQGPVNHTVRVGETIAGIAERYDISINTILWANDLENEDVVQPGKVLLILPVSGVLHKVEAEEAIEDIAWKYQSDVRAIVDFNQLTDPSNLAAGDVLVVPGGRREEKPRPVLATRSDQRTSTQETATPRSEALRPGTYEVSPGDTLSSIAQKFGINQDTIVAANNMDGNPDLISPGQKLTILPVSGVLYTVESGDSIRAIANRLGVDVEDIVKVNALQDANLVQAGQKLIVPGATVAARSAPAVAALTHLVEPGDSVRAIAERYNVNPARIIQANGIRDADVVLPGQSLVIPGGQAPATISRAAVLASGRSNAPAPKPAPGAPAPKPAPAPPPPPNQATGGNWKIVEVASKYLGYPYRWGGTTPAGFDCSGYVWYVYRNAGVPITRDLWGQLQAGPRIRQENLLPGDLVFFENTYTVGLSHNGIYIGGGRFIHAASERVGVIVSSLSEQYWAARYYGANRPW